MSTKSFEGSSPLNHIFFHNLFSVFTTLQSGYCKIERDFCWRSAKTER